MTFPLEAVTKDSVNTLSRDGTRFSVYDVYKDLKNKFSTSFKYEEVKKTVKRLFRENFISGYNQTKNEFVPTTETTTETNTLRAVTIPESVFNKKTTFNPIFGEERLVDSKNRLNIPAWATKEARIKPYTKAYIHLTASGLSINKKKTGSIANYTVDQYSNIKIHTKTLDHIGLFDSYRISCETGNITVSPY